MENMLHADLIFPSIVFVILLLALVFSRVLHKKLEDKEKRTADVLFKRVRLPLQILLILTAFFIVFESLKYRWTWGSVVNDIYNILAVCALGWLGVRGVTLISSLLLTRYDLNQRDN
jgi:hypothetical protein